MKTRKTRLATVTRNIQGQMCRRTVATLGSGSEVSFGLKIRYDLEKEKLLKEECYLGKILTLRRPTITIIRGCRAR